VRLHDLLDATEVLEIVHGPSGDAATTDVSDVTHDSRATHPGALFCCIPGLHVDGHDYAAVAAPVFSQIMQATLRQEHVPPTVALDAGPQDAG